MQALSALAENPLEGSLRTKTHGPEEKGYGNLGVS